MATKVLLWGTHIGTVDWDYDREIATFAYEGPFAVQDAIQLAPLHMPSGNRTSIWSFPALHRDTYHGLPGLLADSLPDSFGRSILDRWLSDNGWDLASVTPIERLTYIGERGMGALTFIPDRRPESSLVSSVSVDELVQIATRVLDQRRELHVSFDDPGALQSIIQVGTSAGGARAKAVIAWNRQNNDIRSGQAEAPDGYEHWLIKFDGVSEAADGSPAGYGRLEYAYYLMARSAGIEMEECRLHHDGDYAHFMTKRFDRPASNERLHMQSLCALGHYDFNQAGAHSYEQAMEVCLTLGLGKTTVSELYRRMVFNVLARNQDDHTKNISFLMDQRGTWALSPAYDVTFNYNPRGAWTSRHQMTINGKRDAILDDDLLAVAKRFKLRNGKHILEEVRESLTGWISFAAEAGVDSLRAEVIESHFR